MTRGELDILLKRYLEQAEDGDYIVIDCGALFAQVAHRDATMFVEVRGDGVGPDLLLKIDELFADFRLDRGGTSETEPGVLGLGFAPGDEGVSLSVKRALDAVASATGRSLELRDGSGAFMPKRKGFLGMGGYGPIV